MDWWRTKAEEMVKEQIESRGIVSPVVLSAMKAVPRHLFIPETVWKMAYEDCALPVGLGQTISQPYMVARMTELLNVVKGSKILEIGTGSGYQAAVLAEIGADVVSIERIEELAVKADKLLKSLGYGVKVITADGREGFSEGGPYQGIIVTAACERIEEQWEEQLAAGGRLVLPLRVQEGLERLLVRERIHSGDLSDRWYDYCHFVPVVKGIRGQDQQ